MGSGHAGQRVDPTPAIAMKHRQGPEFDVVMPDAHVDDHVVGVQVAVAVRHHDALGPAGRARCVVDGNEVVLTDLRENGLLAAGRVDERVPGHPVLSGVVFVVRDDPMFHAREGTANLIEDRCVLPIDEDRRDAGMIQDVLVVRGHEAVVQGDENDADLCRRVEAFEEEMRVWAQDADAVPAFQAEVE